MGWDTSAIVGSYRDHPDRKAVSYTHLDVYKRQAHYSLHAGRGCLLNKPLSNKELVVKEVRIAVVWDKRIDLSLIHI